MASPSKRADSGLRHTESGIFRIEHLATVFEHLPMIGIGLHFAHELATWLSLVAVVGIVGMIITYALSEIGFAVIGDAIGALWERLGFGE